MADVVDKVLGVSSALSGLVSCIFYRLYRSRTETVRQVKNIPVWQPDLKLQDHLSVQEGHSVPYAAVEGVVTDMGRSFTSHHGVDKGVVLRSQIVEHKSKRINGFWSDEKKIIKDTTEMVPFAISKQGGDSHFNIEVTEPALATRLREDLETTYDRFEPSQSGLIQVGLDRFFGDVTKGVQETEFMLRNGTVVLGIGKLVLQHEHMKLQPPDEASRSYIITKMRLSELIRHYESQSATYRILAIVTTCVAGACLAYVIYRHAAKWIRKRRQRLEFEEIRKSLQEMNRSRTGSGEEVRRENLREDETCVVCLANPRTVIALQCGHLALCADCAEALPSQVCPVCRAPVVRFMPVYRP